MFPCSVSLVSEILNGRLHLTFFVFVRFSVQPLTEIRPTIPWLHSVPFPTRRNVTASRSTSGTCSRSKTCRRSGFSSLKSRRNWSTFARLNSATQPEQDSATHRFSYLEYPGLRPSSRKTIFLSPLQVDENTRHFPDLSRPRAGHDERCTNRA